MFAQVDAVTRLLHRHGALSFWDYASAAPYIPVNMNPIDAADGAGAAAKDAAYFSPHKLLGGVNTPGVLVVNDKMLCIHVPVQ